jgi:hypothetical protein
MDRAERLTLHPDVTAPAAKKDFNALVQSLMK